MYKCKNVVDPLNVQSTPNQLRKRKRKKTKTRKKKTRMTSWTKMTLLKWLDWLKIGLQAENWFESTCCTCPATTNPTKTILISPSKNKHTRETATLSTSRPATTPTSAPKKSSFGGSWVVSVVLMDLCRDCFLGVRFHNSWSWKLGILLPSVCWTAVGRVVRRGRSNSVSICPAICVTAAAVCE
jgi:hypothetical protein